jgi:uncharacterized protein (TIGR04255 family)
MNTATLGTWHNPPLAYVVAELVISPYYSMRDAVPDLQNRLRSAYPRTVEGQELIVDGAKPSPQPVWRLISADQKHGLQLGARAISLHATSYLRSSDFLSRWAEVLDAVASAGLGAFVERAGLRYIDLIVPASDRSPAEYLNQHLQGVTPEGAISTGSMWAAAFQFGANTVNLRTAAPAPRGLLLPPDFNALPLHKPRVMLDAEERLNDNGEIGFVDTDCITAIQQVFEARQLVSAYTEMQKHTSRTFQAALSSLAKKEWE